MKRIILIAALTVIAGIAAAQVYVRPHVTRDGTYVEGHQRTAPNNTNLDNYSTRGNTNPYTGQQGTLQPNYTPPVYQAPQQNYGQQQCGTLPNGQYVCR